MGSDGVKGWNVSYFKGIGLGDLLSENFKKIGSLVLAPGTPVGDGLAVDVATELGLLEGTPVGTSIIDAHAGGLGLIGCCVENVPSEFHSRLSKNFCTITSLTTTTTSSLSNLKSQTHRYFSHLHNYRTTIRIEI